MVDLTRRWFVFGSVAAVAAAAIPSAAQAFLEPAIERLPSAHVYLKRSICEFMFAFEDVPADAPEDESASISVYVHHAGERAEQPILHVRMNVRGVYRWVGCGEEIVMMVDETFEIEVGSTRRVGKFHLIAADTVDEGPPIMVQEIHDWPRVGPVEPMYLHADNSLEARIARRDAIPSAPFDDDYDDDYDV